MFEYLVLILRQTAKIDVQKQSFNSIVLIGGMHSLLLEGFQLKAIWLHITYLLRPLHPTEHRPANNSSPISPILGHPLYFCAPLPMSAVRSYPQEFFLPSFCPVDSMLGPVL